MSSTALVSRQLADQGELTTRHGRSAIAVLVFQDLASVPLLALLAIWARGESPKIESVLLEVLGVLMLFAAAAFASRRLLHGLLGWVARQGHEESFVLVSLCVVVVAAAAAHAVGVSAPPWVRFWPAWCWARATSGTTWKTTSNRFAMCCRGCSS